MKKILFKSKKNTILLIILVLLVYCIYYFILAREISDSAINSYLKTIHIDEKEISSLEIFYDFKIGSQYNIIIEYKNEPNLKYEYTYKIKKNKLILFDIMDKSASIAIDKKIIPLHETPKHIENIYFSKYPIMEMKYSFFDYIKDIIK